MNDWKIEAINKHLDEILNFEMGSASRKSTLSEEMLPLVSHYFMNGIEAAERRLVPLMRSEALLNTSLHEERVKLQDKLAEAERQLSLSRILLMKRDKQIQFAIEAIQRSRHYFECERDSSGMKVCDDALTKIKSAGEE